MPGEAYNSDPLLASSVSSCAHAASCTEKVCVSETSIESGLTRDFDNAHIKQSESVYHHSGEDYTLYQFAGKWYLSDKDSFVDSYIESRTGGACPVGLSYIASVGGGSSALKVKEGECSLSDAMASVIGTVITLLVSIPCCCCIAFCIYKKCAAPPATDRAGPIQPTVVAATNIA